MNIINVLAKYTAGIVLIYFSVYPAVFVRAQQASGSISGYITCGDGNFPARGATVELISVARLLSGASGSSTANSAKTITDFSGWYEIWTVAAGTYIVNVTFDGYSDNLKLVRPRAFVGTPKNSAVTLACCKGARVKPPEASSFSWWMG
jgi:hypothetical protein